MFGDLKGMMDKLKETQLKVEETKKRLDTVLIDESGANDKLKVTVNANRKIKSISIANDLLEDNEELEDYLIVTLNKALNRANAINEQEMASAAKSGMPNIPGMDGLF